MSYLVKTFRGYDRDALFENAEAKAHEMISDIITDGFGCEFWWATIYDEVSRRYLFVSCPKVGCWAKSGWFRYRVNKV